MGSMKGSFKWLVGAGMTLAVMGLTGASAFADTTADFSGAISFSNPNQGTYTKVAGMPIGIQLNTSQIASDNGNPAGSEFHVHGLPPYLTFVFQEYSPAGEAFGAPMSATGTLAVTNSVYGTDNIGSTATGVYTVTPPVFPQYWSGGTVNVAATVYNPPGSNYGVQAGDITPYMWQPDWTGNPSGTTWVNAQGMPSMAAYTSFSQNMYDNDDPVGALKPLPILIGQLPEVPLAGILPGLMVLGGAVALVRKHKKNK